MNLFDIFVAIVVAYGLIRGIFRGLIKEVAAIVGVLAGFWAAYSYYPLLGRLLDGWIDTAAYRNILSFLLIFALVLLTISVVGVIIKYLLRVAFLGGVDRFCGALFGLLKAVLISAVVLMTLTAFLPKGAPLVRDSILAPHVAIISETLARITHKELKAQFESKAAELHKLWRSTEKSS